MTMLSFSVVFTFLLIISYLTSLITSYTSCRGTTTKCVVNKPCIVQKPKVPTDNATLVHSPKIRVNFNYSDDEVSFTPTAVGRNNNLNFTFQKQYKCSSNVWVLGPNEPVKKSDINCSVNRTKLLLVCNFTKDIFYEYKVSISTNSEGKYTTCNCSEVVHVIACQCPMKMEYIDKEHKLNVTKFTKKISNMEPAAVNTTVNIYTYNKVQPNKLEGLKEESWNCSALKIRLAPNDTFIPTSSIDIVYKISITHAQDASNTVNIAVVSNRTSPVLTINQLYPNTNYILSITWSVSGSEYWSNSFIYNLTTDPCVPSISPDLYKGGYTSVKNNRIVLYWKKIPNNQVNAPSLKYIIYRIPAAKLQHNIKTWEIFSNINNLSKIIQHNYVLDDSHQQVFNGSKTSGILDTNFQKGDVVVIRSNNYVGASEKYSLFHISKDYQIQSSPQSLHKADYNSSHLMIDWTIKGNTPKTTYIYKCSGFWFEELGWVECVDSMVTISRINGSISNKVFIPNANPTEGCKQCSWFYGISVEYNNITSPILWDKSPLYSNGSSDESTIYMYLYLSLGIFLILVIFFVCFLYRKRTAGCFRSYNISIPYIFTGTSDQNQEEILGRVSPSPNITTSHSSHFEESPLTTSQEPDTTNESYGRKFSSYHVNSDDSSSIMIRVRTDGENEVYGVVSDYSPTELIHSTTTR